MQNSQPGRDSMLATVAMMWWSLLHREVVGIAQTYQQCQTAGEKFASMLRQNR